MKTTKSKQTFLFHRIPRWFRLQYMRLIRAKGGPSIVAMGFSIGLAIEMFTLPTGGLAFLLIFPLVYCLRASTAGAMIGFVTGKLIYLPMTFLMRRIGGALLPKNYYTVALHLPGWLERFVKLYLKLFVGGVVLGPILGLLGYFPVKWILQWMGRRREERRRQRKASLQMAAGTN